MRSKVFLACANSKQQASLLSLMGIKPFSAVGMMLVFSHLQDMLQWS